MGGLLQLNPLSAIKDKMVHDGIGLRFPERSSKFFEDPILLLLMAVADFPLMHPH